MKFRPVLDALEDRKLMSFGGGNVDTSIPRFPSTSPQLNFTSNSFHNINATIPGVASAILKTESSTDAQLASYVTNIPNGETTLLPILEADVTKFEHGGAAALTTTQANFIVTTLYNDLLFRDPDSIGLAAFSTELQDGATMAQVADSIVTSQEYLQANTTPGATANEDQTQFVTALYSDVLGRDPEPGGVAYWVNQINTGAQTVQQVATAFVNSPEAATSPTSVLANPTIVTLYGDLLGRFPDSSGLADFTTAFQNGATIEQAVDVFVTSPEYIQANITPGATANQDQTQFVDSLYFNVLGREADPGGEAFWVNELNTGALSVQQVAVDFVSSAEAATSSTSILTTPVITTTGPGYYFGSAAPNGTIFGNFPGTSQTVQLENLIQQDTIAYLGNGIGKSFNILKSGVGWASDNLLTYNGFVS
jgi:Domain of unknown function (DUF4214)